MNILEEIQNCPVEWKELGEISQFYSGLTGKTKSDFENGNAKYVTYKNIFNNIQVEFNLLETVQVDKNERQNFIEYGDVLITGSSESKEEVGMSSTVTFVPDEQIYLNSFSFGIRFNEDIELLPEFTKYLFRSIRLRKQIEKTASGVTRYNISKVTFKKIKVPLLPLEIQEKIVQILDKMTDYVTELTSELTSRNKQYSYYRDKLLSFEDEVYPVEWKELGDKNVAKLSRGKVMSKQFLEENKGEFPVYSSQTANNGEIGRISSFEYDGEYITWTTDGANAGTVFYRQGKFSITNVCGLVEINNDQLLTKFVYYYLTISAKNHVSSGMGNPKLMSNVMGKIKIPIPPLKIQEEIVQILDNFDRVCNDLNIGLPKEIELRQKQYEYWREQLLNFNK